MRKTVRCHQSHRFFTSCHYSVFRLSHKAFLLPFRMTGERQDVIMRETLIVIPSECEGSIVVVRKTVRRHRSNRFFILKSLFRFLSFPQGILASVQNDSGRQGVIVRKASVVILNEREGSITMVRKAARRHRSNRFFI